MDNEKLNILRLLIEQEEALSIRKISKLRKINYKSAYYAVKKLAQEGVVSLKNAGNTTLCSFNRSFNESVFAVECQRRHDLLKNKDLLVMYHDLKKINAPFVALLFGSYAKGTQTKHSDIDLLIITEEFTPIQQQIALLPLHIHATDVRYKEFIQMLRSRELTAVSEAVKKNIILIGIEEYYRLVNNADR